MASPACADARTALPVAKNPIATPTNLMVMEAGGYRFGDYWKLGLPLLLGYGAAGIFLVPLIWPL